MSDSARDPAMQAAARLEAAVERLASVLQARLARPRMDAGEADPMDAEFSDMVPRAEVAALAERLEATIVRLRAALPEELRPGAARPAMTTELRPGAARPGMGEE